MLADIVTKSTLDTMIPSGKNSVNTNENYRKGEKRKVEGGRSTRSNSQLSAWYLKGIHNYSVTFLLPLFLAVCFLISMLGVVFLFTTFFLVSKIYVLRVFVSECNTVLIILIFLANGLHLLTIGVTGVVGLGNKWWILFTHSLLAVGLLFTMAATIYYVPKYEPFVMQETEMNMWSSLSKTRLKYHSGWKYIQFNMNCCGVSSYTDWCGCKNVTEIRQFKMYSLSSSFSKGYEKTSENILPLNAKLFEAKDIKSISDRSFLSDNDSKENESKENESMKLFFTKLQPPVNHNKSLPDKEHQGVNYIQKEQYNIVECFIPDSCCIVKETFRFKPKKCVIGKFNDGIYNEGCHAAVQHTIKHFLASFISICKFIMIITMLDLPLSVMMIFT